MFVQNLNERQQGVLPHYADEMMRTVTGHSRTAQSGSSKVGCATNSVSCGKRRS